MIRCPKLRPKGSVNLRLRGRNLERFLKFWGRFQIKQVQSSFEEVAGNTNEDNKAKEFRYGHIPLLPSVEIFKDFHPLSNDVVDFYVEKDQHGDLQDVKKDKYFGQVRMYVES